MDPKLQQSFIPKQSLAQVNRPMQSSGVGIFSLLSFIVLLIAGALSGGIYLYKNSLKADLSAIESEISSKKATFELDVIGEMKQFEARVSAARAIVSNHVAFSRFFSILEESILPTISFRSLNYATSPSAKPHIEARGVADGFRAIALQSDEFLKRSELSNVSFSGFALNKQGFVDFTFSADVEPSAISYLLPPATSTDELMVEEESPSEGVPTATTTSF
jgi:hypothetical protein